ncbi:MAG: hypothetical protein ABJE95_27605 [Byssovorax sp.]
MIPIALLLSGAGAWGVLRPSPEQRIAAEADAAARRVKLASVPGSKLRAAGTTRLRVLVTPAGVTVDGTAMVAAWPPAIREAMRRASPDAEQPFGFFERDVAPLPSVLDGEGELTIRPLLGVLEHARGLEKLRADVDSTDPAQAQASVLIDGDLPFAAVVPVLYTLGQSDHQQLLVVEAPGGQREIVLKVPTYRERVGAYADVLPEITLGPDGPAVRIQGASIPRQGPLSRNVRGRLVVDDDRACPTAPGAQGTYDHAKLGRVLRLIRDRVLAPPPPPGGESKDEQLLRAMDLGLSPDAVQIAPSRATPWREIASLADLAAEAGYSGIQLMVPHGAPQATSTVDCETAVMASDLHEGDADFFRR